MEKMNENNQVKLSGEMISNFEFSHKVYGEGFYVAEIAVGRTSGQIDRIPVMVSERLLDVKEKRIGQFARVSGQFRSYNRQEKKKHLILVVFVEKIEIWKTERKRREYDKNCVLLYGYVCKIPVYRKTPLGREITDLLLAVRMPHGKSVYIPCICWGRNARYAGGFEVGQSVWAQGRIQSRNYQKKISDNEYEARVAYEVSVSSIQMGSE